MLFSKKTDIADVGIKKDYHCHLLPGVDDGVQTLDESLAILRDMRDFGIKEVVLTPHINPDVYPDGNEAKIRERFKWYNDNLLSVAKLGESQQTGANVNPNLNPNINHEPTLRLGAEYMITPKFEKRNVDELLQFQNGKVLIEMSYMYPSDNVEESIFNITSNGLIPVMAHPERYIYYAADLDIYDRFHDMGCEFQLNLLSLSGAYGKGSVKIMEYLMKNGYYRYVGSDTHTRHHFKNISQMKIKKEYKDAIQRFTKTI